MEVWLPTYIPKELSFSKWLTYVGQIKWVYSTLIEFSNWIGNKYSFALITVIML